MKCILNTSIVPDSSLPSLLGLDFLSKMNALIDTRNMRVYFLAHDTPLGLPPGTKTLQGEASITGHLMLPCDDFWGARKLDDTTSILATTNTADQQASTPKKVTFAPNNGAPRSSL